MNRTILVTGGTGTLGRAVVARLLGDGHQVRVVSRRARSSQGSGHTTVVADLRHQEGLDAALADVDAIVHCATTGGRGDVEVTRNLVEAARRAGTPHLVYISIVGVDRIPLGYYRSKFEVEGLIEKSGLGWTILRTTQFHDLIAKLFSLQRWSPVTLVPSGSRFQPIEVGEVADRLVDLAVDEPSGRARDMGGPQVRTIADLARSYLRAAGRRRLVLPVWLPGAAFAALRAGGNLTPENAVGRVGFEEFLRAGAEQR